MDQGPEHDDPPALQLDAGVQRPILAHNSLTITGWAFAAAGIQSVEAHIAGRQIAASQDTGGLVGEAPRPRFELILDTSEWPRGDKTFEVVATDVRGATTTVAGVANIQPYRPPPADEAAIVEAVAQNTPAMWCEMPDLSGGGHTYGGLEIVGWAVAPKGIESVLVTVDDQLRTRAQHGLMRPDLRWCFGDETAAGCGFALRLSRREVPPGRHHVTVVAVTRDGTGLGMSGTVHCLAEDAAKVSPEGTIDPLRDADAPTSDRERFIPTVHADLSLAPEHHARYRWAAPMVAGMRVLDAGCGVGWGTAVLAESAREVAGLDIAPMAILDAVARHGDAADFVEGSMSKMAFGNGEFDAVVAFEAIEYVTDPRQALDELCRVLTPEGLLLISCANRSTYPAGNPLHANELASTEIEAVLRERYSNVAVYRQQTYVGSLVGDDALLACEDPGLRIDAQVAKVVGGRVGSELYAIVAASDGELPTPSAQLALGTALDHEEERRLTDLWRTRCLDAEIEAVATRTEIHYARWVQRNAIEREARRERELTARLKAQEESLSWRVTAPLRSAKRAALRLSRQRQR